MKNFKFQKGFGLVEALIALLIIAVTMVSALRTVSTALRQVKNNETEDKANQLMTSALEFAYGYRNIDLPKISGTQDFPLNDFNTLTNQTLCFRPTVDLQSKKVELTLVANNPTNCGLMNTANNDYLVTYTNNDSNEVSEEIFHQIIFSNIPITGTGNLDDKIRITSVVLYTQEGEIVRQIVDAYRPIFF